MKEKGKGGTGQVGEWAIRDILSRSDSSASFSSMNIHPAPTNLPSWPSWNMMILSGIRPEQACTRLARKQGSVQRSMLVAYGVQWMSQVINPS